MNILLIEPFYTGSHQRWALEFQKFSTHNVHILFLKGKYWKWRMYGGAVQLANDFNQMEKQFDYILVSDMLDLTTFLALTRNKSTNIPTGVYFHENQLTYPWSPKDKDVKLERHNQYAFINYTTALAADKLYFNSQYHLSSFIGALPSFLKQFPDNRGLENVDKVAKKSQVLPLGMNLHKFDFYKKETINDIPIILWNHRWEYDKNPKDFFEALFKLNQENIDFRLVVFGEKYQRSPEVFQEAAILLSNKILHWGYTDNFKTYAEWLWKADILPVTSRQDFFGGSVIEAMYCQCIPILPKRLAFPEHIPLEYHKYFYYNDTNDFYNRLKNAILQVETRNKILAQSFIQHYDWKNLIKHYDKTFQLAIVEA